MEQQEEALVGDRVQRVVREVRQQQVSPDALAGGDVEEAVAAGARDEGLVEHDPLPGVEAAVVQDQAALRARVHGASAPRPAHGAEADVVGHVVGEDALRDQARRPVVPEARPVPPSAERGARTLGSPGAGGSGGKAGVLSLDSPRLDLDVRGRAGKT